MKSSKFALSLGVIALSLGVLGTTLWLGYQASSEVLSANVLSASELPGADAIATTLSYERLVAEGDALYKTGYYQLAGSKYALAVKEDEANPTAHHRLGKAYLKLMDYEKAVQAFARATELDSKDTEYAVDYGRALIRIQDFDRAFEHFQAMNGTQRDVLFYRSLLSATRGDFDSARKEIQEAAKYDGQTDPSALQAVNQAFATFDQQQNGQSIYLEALLAKAMVDAEEYHLAEEISLKILNKESDYRDVWTILGYAQLKLERYEEAKNALDQAVKLDSIKPEIHYFLGLSHYFLEEYDEAVNRFELALLYGFQPENEPYRKIAESQLFLQRYEEALAAYEYLVKIEQSSVDDFARPVWLAIEKVQDLDRALTLAEEAVSHFPNEALSHTLLGWTYLQRGEIDQADESIQRAFQINPRLAEAHLRAGQIREAQGNPEGALWEYEKANELSESGDSVSEAATQNYNRLMTQQSQ